MCLTKQKKQSILPENPAPMTIFFHAGCLSKTKSSSGNH